MKPAIILSTYPDRESIAKIADRLVRDRLAACVNISRVESIYSWQGKIENAPEFLALFKTTQANKDRLREQIEKTHPYQVPEVIEIAAPSINGPYLKWLAESTL